MHAPGAHDRVGRQCGQAYDAELLAFPKITLYIVVPNSGKHREWF